MTIRDVYRPHVVLLLLPAGVGGLLHKDQSLSLSDTRSARSDLEVAAQPMRQPTPPQFQDSNLRYMPSRNLIICGCGKCGTSSMYGYIYEKEFGQPWPYGGSAPYIHEVMSDRWNNSFSLIRDPISQGEAMHKAFSFAIVRDPQERLISAWKSKIACGGLYHTDVDTRTWMTKELLRLAGWNDTATCLKLDGFLRVLNHVHVKNKAYLLDRHFLPQHSGCFYRFPPHEWKSVVAIEDPKAMSSIATHFGSADVRAPASHSSTSKVLVSQQAFNLLENITKLEYKVFGDYLDRPSYVKPGIWV